LTYNENTIYLRLTQIFTAISNCHGTSTKEGKRGRRRRRTEMRWLDTIDNVVRAVGVCIRVVENREKWRSRTKRWVTPNSI